MKQPHAHHVVYENGIGTSQQAIVKEGQEILRRHGLDPVKGLENLVWAPNVKGQHNLSNLTAVVDDLKAAGLGKSDIIDLLTKHAADAAKR